jgi:hypothetical protein
LRPLAERARQAQLSGHALIGAGLALTVFGGAVLLWSGIVTGAPRFLLLVLAAGVIRGRLLAMRLSAMTPADGIAAAPASGVLRGWLNLGEAAALLLAGGLAAYGSGSRLGPALGATTALLLLMIGLRRRNAHAVHQPVRPHPTTLLAITCLVAALEPLWGWRGQSLVIGLSVISMVLLVQLLRAPRRSGASRTPSSAKDPA